MTSYLKNHQNLYEERVFSSFFSFFALLSVDSCCVTYMKKWSSIVSLLKTPKYVISTCRQYRENHSLHNIHFFFSENWVMKTLFFYIEKWDRINIHTHQNQNANDKVAVNPEYQVAFNQNHSNWHFWAISNPTHMDWMAAEFDSFRIGTFVSISFVLKKIFTRINVRAREKSLSVFWNFTFLNCKIDAIWQ